MTTAPAKSRREWAIIRRPFDLEDVGLQDAGQKFFDSFVLFAGIFVGAIVSVIFFLRIDAIETRGHYAPDDPEVRDQIAERLAPIGHIAMLGDAELAAASPAVTETPARVQAPLSGPQVYNTACYLCHAPPGVGGAPVIGDNAAWADRAARGIDLLAEHAINGFQGEFGVMPAKGGRLDLSDEEVIAAIEYMLEQLAE